MWLPVKNAWQLNERHYGGLTGLNKQETVDKVGEEQVYTCIPLTKYNIVKLKVMQHVYAFYVALLLRLLVSCLIMLLLTAPALQLVMRCIRSVSYSASNRFYCYGKY
jgi:hypothetical protein